jgi:hypothetical protein
MTIGLPNSRSLLLIAAALLAAAAVVMVAGIIPPVKTDTSAAAAPDQAAMVFRIWAVGSLACAVALGVLSRPRSRLKLSTCLTLAWLVLLLAMAAGGPALSFRGHGRALWSASNLMLVCAALGVAALALVTTVAVRVRDEVPMSTGNRVAAALLFGFLGILLLFAFGDAGSGVLPTVVFVLTVLVYFLVVGYVLSRGRATDWPILGALCAPLLLTTVLAYASNPDGLGAALEPAVETVIAILGSLAGGTLAGRRAHGAPAP